MPRKTRMFIPGVPAHIVQREIKIKGVRVEYPDFLGHFNDGTIPEEVSNEHEKELPQSL